MKLDRFIEIAKWGIIVVGVVQLWRIANYLLWIAAAHY